MGFYIRKSINLGGGVRLNLSKSGLGLSAGVKGLRFGVNGRGTYVHMGRGGLYYRQQLSWNKQRGSTGRRSQQTRGSEYRPEPQSSNQGVYASENLALPLDVSSGAADVDDVLKYFKPRVGWSWVPVLFGILALIMAFSNMVLSAAFAVCGVLSVLVLRLLRDRAILIYDLDEQAEKRFENFVNQIEVFMKADRLWLYETRSATSDWKRNAGAGSLINRRAATFGIDQKVRSNISIPCISSGADRIYFLPDLVVCASGDKVGAFGYSEFNINTQMTRFVEEEHVPADSVVVDHTWRFVNKNGGPDRRFNNNRQIPICAYQELDFTVGPSFRRVVAKSRQADIQLLLRSVTDLRALMRTMQEVTSPGLLPAPKVTAIISTA